MAASATAIGAKSLRGGRYRVLAEVGEGGQGHTLLALDRLVDRRVVLKLAARGEDTVAGEYRALVALDHARVVRVHDLYREPLLAALVLVEDWIEGRSLAERLGDLDQDEWQRVAIDMLAAVAHLRAVGVRHGDLKPANIMLRRGARGLEAVLVDFGFAAAMDSPLIPGATPAYLAPECRDGRGSPAADLWALGLTLAQALTGASHPPMGGDLDEARALDRRIAALLLEDPASRIAAFESLVAADVRGELPLELPFVGRGRERRALLREVVRALDGRGEALLSVAAHPGRGAGRLVGEVIAELRGTAHLAFFRRDWFDLELLLREAAAELGEGFDLQLPDDRSPDSLAVFLWSLLRRRGLTGTIGLGRDAADLPQGRALVAMAARQEEGSRHVVVVRVSEPDEEGGGLAALDASEVGELVGRLLPRAHAVEPELAGRLGAVLFELSGGHPALIESLLRAAVSRGALALERAALSFDEAAMRGLEVAAGELPEDPEARLVAEAFAANLGRLDRAALAELLDLSRDRIERGLELLRRGGFIRDPGGEGRPLAYLGPERSGTPWPASAAGQERTEELVARIAGWLDSPWPDSVHRHASRALAGRRGPRVAALRFLAIRSLAAQGERRRALAELQNLDHDERRSLEVLEPALLEATLLGALGRREEALAAIERGLAEVRDDDREARLLAEAAYIELLGGHSREALDLADRAFARGRDEASRARAATMAATAARRLGDVDGALARFAVAEEVFARLGDRRRSAALVANRAMADLDAGRPGRAARALEQARLVLSEVGSIDQLAGTTHNLGVARQSLRDFGAAARALAEAERLFGLLGDRDRAAAARAAHGIALVDGADPLAGAALLRSAATRLAAGAEREANPVLENRLRLELARADLLAGRPGRARRGAGLVDRDLLDPPSAERLDGLRRALDPAGLLAGPLPVRRETARRLRSRDLVVRGFGLLESVVLHREGGRLDLARRGLRRITAFLDLMEKDMSEARRGLHRARVGLPVLEALRARVEIDLLDGGGALLAGVHETMQAVYEAPDLVTALRAAARGVLGLGRALRVYVATWDGARAEILAEARRDGREGTRPELSTLVLRRVAATAEPVIVADAGADDLLGFAGSVRALGLRSVACFPLLGDDERRIMLYIDTPLESGAFDEAHLRAVATFVTVARTACSLHDRALRGEAGRRAARREVEDVRRELTSKSFELERLRSNSGFGRIAGESPAIRRTLAIVAKVAPTDLAVLVTGETGSGKELVAQAIHAASLRASGPFIAVNCANINPQLAESELFGHVKGAFTGAIANRDGLFALAAGGTIFLDEVGEIPLELQAKLLRVLETHELRPVGGREAIAVDVRVIAATNRDARDEEGFRRDLFFRLAQVEIRVPPLRERAEDVPLIVGKLLEERGRGGVLLEKEAMAALSDYDWPGNVRQLRNVIERCLLLAEGDRILLSDLPEEIWRHRGPKPPTLAEMEKEAIRAALRYTGGEKKAAAEVLGISRTAIYEKIRRLGPDLLQ